MIVVPNCGKKCGVSEEEEESSSVSSTGIIIIIMCRCCHAVVVICSFVCLFVHSSMFVVVIKAMDIDMLLQSSSAITAALDDWRGNKFGWLVGWLSCIACARFCKTIIIFEESFGSSLRCDLLYTH